MVAWKSCTAALLALATWAAAAAPLPIIIDTDIGDDFDDSWALALAVARPDLCVIHQPPSSPSAGLSFPPRPAASRFPPTPTTAAPPPAAAHNACPQCAPP